MSAVDGLATSLSNLNRAAGEFSTSMGTAASATAAGARDAITQVDLIAAAYARAEEAQSRFRDAASRPLALAGPGGGGGGDYIDGEYTVIDDGAPRMLGYDAAVAGAAGGGGRGGGGGGGGGSGANGGGRRGGFRLGIPQLIEGAAVYEAMHSGMSEEASLYSTMQRGFHLDPTDPQNADVMASLRRAAHDAAQGTSFSEAEAAGGMATLAAPLGQRGRAGAKSFLPIFESAAKIAEAGKQMGIGSYEDTLAGAIEYAHQTGTYDPNKLNARLNDIFAITEALPETNIHEQTRIMSYAVPEATALGVDPTEAARAVGFLERAGLRGTKSATTLRQFMLGNMKTGGPMNAHLTHESESLSRELSLSSEGRHAVHAMSGDQHIKALHELGIIDARGHNVTMDADGNYDLDAGLTAISSAAKRMGRAEFGHAMYSAYGVRGEDADLLAEHPDLFAQWQKDVAPKTASNPTGTDSAQVQLARISQTAQQTTGQAGARLNDVLNTLATSIMGVVQPAMKGLADSLAALNNELIGHPHVAQAASVAGIGASVASLWGGFTGYLTGGARGALKGAVSWPARYAKAIFGGGRAAAGAAEAGETAGIGGEILGGAEVAGGGLLATLASPEILAGAGAAAVGAGGYGLYTWATGGSGGSVGGGPGTFKGGNTAIHINVGPITLNGVGTDIEPLVQRLFHEMGEKLGDALSHSSSSGFGNMASPFTLGATP